VNALPEFIKGIELCESFFNECGLPIIRRHYPGLKLTAGLIGYGSDVLGYDDTVSTDHMWGPRFYIFLDEKDIHLKDDIIRLFQEEMPYVYKGYSVNFTEPDQNDNNVRSPELINSGRVSPLVWIYTIGEFIKEYLGELPSCNLDWLTISEHRLLGFTAGKLFIDMLGISEIRKTLSFYPKDAKLYLIASQWAVIAEEQAFVKRCGDCNDDLGSRIICARIAERLMRLCFLYENKYAPYSKWFGTGFMQLPISDEISNELTAAISAKTTVKREKHIINAQVCVARLHNDSGITEPHEVRIQKYYGRNIDVIFTDAIANKVKDEISDPTIKNLPLIGSLSQIGNFVKLSDNPSYQKNIKYLYKAQETTQGDVRLLQNHP